MSKFIWGAATSSYQIEGAATLGNRSPGIWDTFCNTPGKVANGDSGEVAIDHFHRYKEDIAIIKSLGLDAYRFSLSWPRLFPEGMDKPVEQAGVDFYNSVIDELIVQGITPMITLFHWDLPQYIEDRGGWATRQVVDDFAKFALASSQLFGDRVKSWITLNEPWCTTWLGYFSGIHAPGKKDVHLAVASAHHTALAHAAAYRAIKSHQMDAEVGITLNMTHFGRDSDDNETFRNWQLVDQVINQWWISALLTGKYPQEVAEYFGEKLQNVYLEGDENLLKSGTDFLGINYYNNGFVGKARPGDKPIQESAPYPFEYVANLEMPESEYEGKTDFDWPVTPSGIEKLLLRVHRDWPEISALYITENGAAYNDGPDENGEVLDLARVNYLVKHVHYMQEAIKKGVPVKGYFAWSLLDNFEWAAGYDMRFGIIHVDFKTQKRTWKQSAFEYQKIIAQNQ
jgi:beta-glucosidase